MRVDLGGRGALVIGGAALGRSVAALLAANGARVGADGAADMLVNFAADTADGAGRSDAVAAEMAARGGGCIVQVASVAGLVPVRGDADRAAAAAGVFARTRAMALALAASGVRVNAVATLLADDDRPAVRSHIPSGRVATAAEIGNAVLFLLAPASRYVTGHVLTVDGGWSAGFARDF